MLNPETENGRIKPVETRLSRAAHSTQQLKELIQRSINESESDPREIEIVGEDETWSLCIPHTALSLVNALPPRHKGTRDRFFSLVVDPALEKATYMIVRPVPSFKNEHLR